MTTCPTCSTETHGRKCSSSYCEGHADGEWEGRQAAIRDEVEHGAAWLEDQADRVPRCMGADRAESSLRAKAADCRRWLQETA